MPSRGVLQKKRDNRSEWGALLGAKRLAGRREGKQQSRSAEGVPRGPEVREVGPGPASGHRRGITLRWSPWGSHSIAPDPPPEPEGPGQAAPCAWGEGARPRRLRSSLLGEPRLGPWPCPTGICGCAQGPQSPRWARGGALGPRTPDPGGGGGWAGKRKVLENREASASRAGNRSWGFPRGVPAAPLPGEQSPRRGK